MLWEMAYKLNIYECLYFTSILYTIVHPAQRGFKSNALWLQFHDAGIHIPAPILNWCSVKSVSVYCEHLRCSVQWNDNCARKCHTCSIHASTVVMAMFTPFACVKWTANVVWMQGVDHSRLQQQVNQMGLNFQNQKRISNICDLIFLLKLLKIKKLSEEF